MTTRELQRQGAQARSIEVRSKRAKLKRLVASEGSGYLVTAMERDPEWLAGMRVLAAVLACRGFGPKKAKYLLDRVDIPHEARFKDLFPYERERLLEGLRR